MVEIIKLFNKITSLMYVQEFRQRFISTTILSFLFLLLFLLDSIFFQIIFSLLFSFVFFEYEKLTSKTLQKLQIIKILILQIILLFFTIFESYKIENISLLFNNFIIFLLISVFFNSIFLFYKKPKLINFIISNIIILSFFSLIGILKSSNGLYIFLYAVILVSTMDIFGYLGGNLFGKRKIIPVVSKGKTVEGTIIGLTSTIIISYFIKDLINSNIMYSLIYGFLIGIIAFSGDLLESFFKRKIGVKDSGNLIPGHGGLMDRFDGYFLVIPFLYIFII